MDGRQTILGLSLRLLRAWGARPWHAMVALGATGAIALLAGDRSPRHASPARARASRDAAVAAQRASELFARDRALDAAADHAVFNVALTSSSDGFVAAWVRNRPDRALECAPLARDGSLRGQPVSVDGVQNALRPVVARAGDRVVIAWIELVERRRPEFVWSWAVLDERCRVVLSPRPIGFSSTATLGVSIAIHGTSVAFASRPISDPDATDFVLRTLSGEALVEARVLPPSQGLWMSIAHADAGWLVAYDDIDGERMRTDLRLRRVSARGALIDDRVVRRAQGTMEFVRVRSDSDLTVLSWGEDGTFARRYDPYLSMIRGGIPSTPVPLGPRRTASDSVFACNDTGCASAWVGVGAEEADRPQWLVERYTIDGRRARGPFVLGRDSAVSLWSPPAIAASASGDAFLSMVSTRSGVAVQRLDREGRPQEAAKLLPL